MTANRKCRTCQFYVRDILGPAPAQGDQDGVCRFNPPTTLVVPYPNSVVIRSMFPPVKELMWCGQWAPFLEVVGSEEKPS